ncbi:HD domain-containing protein [Shimia abyssi]|uniref:Putative hydrolase of HD superfamily n=1 Tax=Shimia abyssi TaxID=1662395 RepID=A0A2P8FC97_9RHOB|nr:HD domain-containing protein [Shimia abyssi]PSL19308.1 putative hydrolase of HD superfamily [Shimia abyssi]
MTDRLEAQFAFLKEADHLKSVLRASRLIDDSRFENSAEHSWHVMLYALVLADQAEPTVDINRVLKMLLLHDIVEIDAGDAPIHGNVDYAAKAAEEEAAAERLFGLLPDDLSHEFKDLWRDFEAGESAESRFAKSIDRIPTPITNLEIGGGSWVDYNVTLDQIDARVGTPINTGTPGIWSWLRPKLATWFARNAG